MSSTKFNELAGIPADLFEKGTFGMFINDSSDLVPLQSVDVKYKITSGFSEAVIKQNFRNKEKVAIEVLFCFPKEYETALNRLEIITSSAHIKATAEERDKAFDIYDSAIAKGDMAVLLDSEDEDILVISVGNINPGEEVDVIIGWIGQLNCVDGLYRLQIPNTVSPRYDEQTEDPVKIDKISGPYSINTPYKYGIEISVLKENGMKFKSPSHSIKITETEAFYTIAAEQTGIINDRDFILEITDLENWKSKCIVSEHENGDKAMMLRILPEFPEPNFQETDPGEIVFLIDCSGSMQGGSIEATRNAVELCLSAMKEGEFVSIVCFGSSYKVFNKDFVRYDRSSISSFMEYVKSIEADMGGTELLSALESACTMPKKSAGGRNILLFTDGEVSNTQNVIDFMKLYSDTRVFAFGIGFGASHQLVKGIAKVSGGAAEMIQPGESIEPVVLRQFARLNQAVMEKVSIKFIGIEGSIIGKIPTFYDGDTKTVFAEVENVSAESGVTVTGYYQGIELIIIITDIVFAKENAIPVLKAKSEIEQLSDGMTRGSAQLVRKNERIKNRIISLSKRYNIISKYTSLVAVIERSSEEKNEGTPEFRKVPMQLTRDWHGADDVSPKFLKMSGLSMKPQSVNVKNKFVENETDHIEILRCVIEGYDDELYALLKTQSVEGYFANINLVMEFYTHNFRNEFPYLLFIEFCDKASENPLYAHVLLTQIVVAILSELKKEESICRAALMKANGWLKKNSQIIQKSELESKIGMLSFDSPD